MTPALKIIAKFRGLDRRRFQNGRIRSERGVSIVKKNMRNARYERRIAGLAVSFGAFAGFFGASALLMLIFQA
jgi:hypothetical protein